MAASKGTPSVNAERNPLRMVLFILSIGLCLLCFYLILNFQSSVQAKLSGELILGQVDSASYNHKDSPILSFLLEYFGVLIYFFALMIVYLGYFLILKPVDIWHADFYKGSLRILGFNCTLLGMSGILSRYSDLGSTGAGGLLGDMLNMFCDLALPNIVTVFIFAMVAFCGIAMLLGKSPFFFFDSIGELFFKVLPAKSQSKKRRSLSADDDQALALSDDLGAAAGATLAGARAQAESLEELQAPAMEQKIEQAPAQNLALEPANEPQMPLYDGQMSLFDDPTNPPSQGPSAESQNYAQQAELLESINNDAPVKQLELPQDQELGLDNNVPLPEGLSGSSAHASGNLEQAFMQGMANAIATEQAQGVSDGEPKDFFAQVLSGEHGRMSPQDPNAHMDLPEVSRDDLAQGVPALDENASRAAQQLFAHEVPAEEDSAFTNALAGLEDHENLSKVPPMPNLNGSDNVNPSSMPDFFAKAMQSGEQVAASYNQEHFEQSSLKGQEPYATTSVEPDISMGSSQSFADQAPAQDLESAYQAEEYEPHEDMRMEDAQDQDTLVPDSSMQLHEAGVLDEDEGAVSTVITRTVTEVLEQVDESESSPYGYGTYAAELSSQRHEEQAQDYNLAAEDDSSPYGYGTYAAQLSSQRQDAGDEAAVSDSQQPDNNSADTKLPEDNEDRVATVITTGSSKPQESVAHAVAASIEPAESLEPADTVEIQEVVDAVEPVESEGEFAPESQDNSSVESSVAVEVEGALASTLKDSASAVVSEVTQSVGASALAGGAVASVKDAVSSSVVVQDTASKLSSEDKADKGTSEVEADSEVEGEEAVHTIVQRTDPKVIAAQLAAKKKEKEERERQERQERERKAREQREQREKEAAERQERERKAQEERERQERELSAQDSDLASSEDDDEYEYVYEEEETPLYLGTYASQLEREKAAQNGHGGKVLRKVKKLKDQALAVEDEAVVASESESSEDYRPSTIIRDTRKELEAQQEKVSQVAVAASQADGTLEAESSTNVINVASFAEDISSKKENFNFDFAKDQNQDASSKSELLEELSSLASEMDDAQFQHLNPQEPSTESHEAEPESDEIARESEPSSTNIQLGSGAPASSSQRCVQGNDNTTTNIKRNDEVVADTEDNDFYRFATARDNEMQAGMRKSVEVNLFSEDDNDTYEPQHAYDFGGHQVGKIDESLSGVEGGSDDEFVTGAAIPNPGLPRSGGFDFARFVRDDKDEDESKSLESNNESDNIIAFDGRKSYEVDGLTSAFIPSDEDMPFARNRSSSSVFDSSLSDYESKARKQAQEQAAAAAQAKAAAEQAAAQAAAAQAAAAAQQQVAEAEYEGDDGEDSFDNGQGMNGIDPFTASQMMNNQAAMANAAQGMYNPMANNQQMQYVQMPNGQYVPMVNNGMMYQNMPNMNMNPNMAMNQMMPNMGQYMMPNGQIVPVMNNMPPNMIYPNGQMPMGMGMAMPNNAAMVNMMQAGAMAPEQVSPGAAMDGTGVMFDSSASSLGDSSESYSAPLESAPVDTGAGDNNLHLQESASEIVETPSAHTVGLPSAGNAFMGAHNSSSSNFPSYMSGVSQPSEQRSSLAMCSVPRRRYDDWRPSLDLLARSKSKVDVSLEDLDKTAKNIDSVLHSFGVKASVADYLTGPVITRFDLELAPGVKSSAISSIDTELCRNLMVPNVRVVPIIEGSSYVGLEVPNPERQFITLADMASSREFQDSKASLPMCLGASVVGAPVVKDLADSPHLLVAGTTGSGKSAGLNTMLISLLLKRSPSELRLILVDPKQLEFSIYKDLPHLITPVITDVAEKTPIALRWCVDEMERRFKLMSLLGVRKLSEYNELIKEKAAQGQSVPDPLWNKELSSRPQALEPLPWIVVVVEEFADLMAQSGRKKDKDGTPESLIARLSAKSRAAGIHLVLVTQTPRSEVVTGMIKANFPSRVAFTVQNRIDSTIVLDEKGAECLLGNGDMLYKFTGEGTSTRAHGAFTSNADVMAVVNAWKQYAGAPEYLEDVVAVQEEETDEGEEGKAKELDVKFDQAVSVVRDYMERRNKPPTVTDLQTELGVGYPRAKKIFMQLSREGIID